MVEKKETLPKINLIDKVRDTIKPPLPIPKTRPECEWWTNLREGFNEKGTRVVWLPNEDVRRGKKTKKQYDADADSGKNGSWEYEYIVKQLFYLDQIRILDIKMEPYKTQIQEYQNKIVSLKRLLKNNESQRLRREIGEDSLGDKIDALRSDLKKLKDEGTLETDTSYILLEKQIRYFENKLLQLSNLRQKSKKSEKLTDESIEKQIEDIEAEIAKIKKIDLEPLEEERERNEYWSKRTK